MKRLRIVSILLTVVLLLSVLAMPVGAGTEMEANWVEMLREAEAAVTPEQIAEAERIMEETEDFLSDLTFETFWEAYLDENKEILELRLSEDELSEIKREMKAWFETSIVGGAISPNSPPVLAYTRHFSAHDGVSLVDRTAIEADGSSAQTVAAGAFPNELWRQDAYRHYLWNFRAVRNVAISAFQDVRIRSTRIYTTNRELVNNILRRNPSLDVANPTATQLATALNLRNNFFNRTFAQWDALFAGTGLRSGAEDLMDLWNNEKGRQDGITSSSPPLLLFNNRWLANTVIRSPEGHDVTAARRHTIWANSWFVPMR